MASLVASMPRALPLPLPEQNNAYRFSTLLHLDCSADLTSYSKSLGPGAVQPRMNEMSGQALRFEGHQGQLRLQVDRQARAQAVPAFVQTPNAVTTVRETQTAAQYQLQAQPNPAYANQAQQIQPSQRRPYHLPSTPAQYVAEHPTPPRPQKYSPVIGNIDTYPPALARALMRSAATNNRPEHENGLYHVINHIEAEYLDDERDTIESHRRLHDANVAASEFFIKNFWGAEIEGEPEYTLSEDGRIRLSLQGEEQEVTVFVQKGGLRNRAQERLHVQGQQVQPLGANAGSYDMARRFDSHPPHREGSAPDEDMDTFPPALRQVLERSSIRSRSTAPTPQDAIFDIIQEIDTYSMQHEYEDIGSHRSPHDANLQAAEHFMDEHWTDGEVDNPDFALRDDGTVLLQCLTSDGHVRVYVRKGTMRG